MNIEIEYLYRDAGNFKNFGSIVFRNRKGYSPEWIKQEIENWLIDGEFFIAEKVKFPVLYFSEFPYSPELDHEWHQFFGVQTTEEGSTDKHNRDIDELLELFRQLRMNRI